MAVKKMGFEGLIYYGVQGAEGTTLINNSRDITESFDIGEGDTTERGAGTSPPIETSRVTSRKYGIEWQMLNKTSDTTLAALIAAAVAGTPVAIRTKSHATGKGYDGDMNVKFKKGIPLKGEQTLDFTGTPNDDNRAPLLEV
jgi:hypothetical protein